MASLGKSRIRNGVGLVLVSLLLYNANLREVSSGDTAPARLLPAIIVHERRLYLDSFFRGYPPGAELPYWAQRVGGHYLSSYPILPALLAVPIYFVPVRLYGADSWAFVNLLAKLSATAFAALSVLFVYLALRHLGRESTAVWVALVYAVGTSTWSISSQGLWGHGPAQLFLAAALYCALRSDADARFFDGVGLTTGFMVASRTPTALIAAALIAYVFHRDQPRGVRCLAGFAAVTLGFLAHNLWSFGSVQGGYTELHATHPARHGVGGVWSTSVGEGLLGLLVSPSRGLLVYSPVLLFAFAGMVPSLQGSRREFYRYLAAGFGASLLLLSSYSVWWGGQSFGPRLLTDFLPVLVLFLVPIVERMPTARALKVAFLALLTVAVLVHLVGAFYYPSPRNVDWNTSPRDVDFAHERLWDWKDTQLVRLLRNGPRPVGFGVPE